MITDRPRAEPLVSVIIPCYNQGCFLADAISSVLDQTYRPLEIIVVDDGSTDDTAEVARSFGDRVQLIQIRNSGPAAARNAGLNAANGEYLQFLDADDRLECRKIETHVRYLDDHPDVGLVYGDARCFTTEQPDLRWFKRVPGGGDGPWIEERSRQPGTWLERCLGAPPFHSCCPVVRMSILRRFGVLSPSLPASEDWELWIRLAAHGVQFAFVGGPEAMALVRFSPTSLTSDTRRMRDGHLAMRRVAARYLPDTIKPVNFRYGCVAIDRYCKWVEKPAELGRLAWANRGPALYRYLIASAVKRAGESRIGSGLRAALRMVVPYSVRERLRRAFGLATTRDI